MSIVTCRSHLSRGVPQLLNARPVETLFNYIGGTTGEWRVSRVVTHSGLSLKPATHLQITKGPMRRTPSGTAWTLRGVASSTRFVTREDRQNQDCEWEYNRQGAVTCAALIPVRKSSAWWSLAQGERREILDAQSRFFAAGFRFLPAIARRLQFHRNSGEPFDFVTWIEYAPCDERIFDDLVAALRATDEWRYVEREIDIRLIRD